MKNAQQEKLFGIHPNLLLCFLLIITAYVIYGNMFSHSFIDYDDYSMIVERKGSYDGLTLENMKGIIIDEYPREEPLIVRDLSYLVNAQIFGVLNPKGYLLGNFLLHILEGAFLVKYFSLAQWASMLWGKNWQLRERKMTNPHHSSFQHRGALKMPNVGHLLTSRQKLV